jgi:hypothetical protein
VSKYLGKEQRIYTFILKYELLSQYQYSTVQHASAHTHRGLSSMLLWDAGQCMTLFTHINMLHIACWVPKTRKVIKDLTPS